MNEWDCECGKVAHLSLGSNIGDRLDYLAQAVRGLDEHPGIRVTKISSVYETAAWGLEEQDDFLNVALEVRTSLAPLCVLDVCQRIESDLDRQREVRWGPRTIDIDILLFEGAEVDDERLSIPHPHMLEREFVLVPLVEIAPDLRVGKVVLSGVVAKFAGASTCVKTGDEIEL
ncbi:MAG: 2-amino-4-hydroxy-6-hydroxymethyldihydropteridine diphosphokinase [Turicibacter sp.]|nr:2-amino-4-hydroxy-6-hydroxymethyldihydropteridine diphosphokinase [Turicibacter sp.]